MLITAGGKRMIFFNFFRSHFPNSMWQARAESRTSRSQFNLRMCLTWESQLEMVTRVPFTWRSTLLRLWWTGTTERTLPMRCTKLILLMSTPSTYLQSTEPLWSCSHCQTVAGIYHSEESGHQVCIFTSVGQAYLWECPQFLIISFTLSETRCWDLPTGRNSCGHEVHIFTSWSGVL